MKQYWLVFMLLFVAGCYYKKSPKMRLCSRLDWQSVQAMFPDTIYAVKDLKKRSILAMNQMLATLQNISEKQHTFHNTVRLYDNAKFKFVMNMQMLSILATLSPDHHLRAAADKALSELQKYQANFLTRNATLLKAFQDYVQYGNDDQSKTISTRLFLQKIIELLEHEGANLSEDVRRQLNILSQEIHHLEAQFLENTVHHHSFSCNIHELAGVPQQFLDNLLVRNHECTIPLTYESFFTILENCTNATTREKFFIAWNQRAYHANKEIFQTLMRKRYEYARLIGYKNFAEYESSVQMIGSVQRARDFMYDMVQQTNAMVKNEFSVLLKNLPPSVMLSSSGKLQPWDEAFVKHSYRKKQYTIDSQAVAEYFPLSHVLLQLQKQFGQFFAIAFDEVPHEGLWHKDLVCLRVRLLKTSQIIGYLVFDLYARPGKSEQASQIAVIPTIQDDCHFPCSGLSTIVTNFIKAPEGQETLLEFHDVKILLHEFGHGLHELFGATDFVDLAGTKGPRDFIEVPSQLFELWMTHPQMVKLFSQHYVTKEPLSDGVIQKIIASETFGKASLLQRQCLLSLVSLELGCSDGSENMHDIVQKLYKSIRFDVECDPRDYFETSFEHLISYGSHYYSYVWSQVLAAGLFEYITQHGITDTQVGQQLYTSLLAHGGSQDPQVLIEMLLGKTVTKKALLHSL